ESWVTSDRSRAFSSSNKIMEVQLVTGRTHQVRVHFAHLGYPVAGDPVYGRADDLGIGRQALHAFRLKFTHPTSGRVVEFEAPLPADLTAGLARARAEGLSASQRKGTPQHRTTRRKTRSKRR
ncbi:MAG TPA: hypothetical protein VNA31_05920, partial [bacterium]|nr:hypothetical protein [bacterium]